MTVVDVAVIRCRGVVVDWLMAALNSQSVRSEIVARAGGTTRTRISRSALETLELLVPPKQEQEAIVAIMTAFAESISEKMKKLSKVKKIKTGLLEGLLTGKVRVKVN